MNRRKFLSLLAAPAIVKVANIMPVKAIITNLDEWYPPIRSPIPSSMRIVSLPYGIPEPSLEAIWLEINSPPRRFNIGTQLA